MDFLSFTTAISENPGPLALVGLVTVLFWFALRYYSSETWKLRHLPTVGSSLPVLSCIGTVAFIKDARKVLETGIQKWPGRIFKVPAPMEWFVIVTKPQFIEDMRKAPDHVLSAHEANNEIIQTNYTIGPHIGDNPYHVHIVRNQLKRALPDLMPEVYEEMVDAFRELIPVTEDWSAVKVVNTMMKVVTRATGRVLVGQPLCRNPEWVKLNTEFTVDVVKTGMLLRLFPVFLRPMVNIIISKVPRHFRDALKHLRPIIAARRKEREEKGKDSPDKPVTFMTWLIDEGSEEHRDDLLVSRMLTVYFTAIHTSSMAFTHAMYYLALYPDYWKPLREEVENTTKREGWTKAALDQMSKVDSFIKESQRLHPPTDLTMNRLAVKDFTFSDGTNLPAGSMVQVSAIHMHLDAEVFEDPLKFDGFRFVKMKERAVSEGHPEKKFDIVTTGAHSLAFSHGRHACPGRFFAAMEIKLMFAYVVMTYDMKLVDGVRPPDIPFLYTRMPNATAEVLFRRRKVDSA